MIKIYSSVDNKGTVEELNTIESGAWINVFNPTEEEIRLLVTKLGINEFFIRSSLDKEEISRTVVKNNQRLIIVDVPFTSNEKNIMFRTIPLGIIIIDDDYIVTVSAEKFDVLDDFIQNRVDDFFTFKKRRFIIQMLYRISRSYLKDLKLINEYTDKIETLLQKSTRNKEIFKLLAVEKSLVYFRTSVKSNDLVFDSLLKGDVININDEDKDVLEMAIIENKQAIEASQIYSDVLNGMMDAFSSIISNNLNFIMKFLAGMTIVISIPTMISSFLGMNIPLGFLSKSEYSFGIITLISLIISAIVAIVLKKKNML